MPLYEPPTTTGAMPGAMSGDGTKIGFFGAQPVEKPSGYDWVYNTTTKTLGAYTPMPRQTAYTGGLLDLLQAARLTDLNALRASVENLRVFTENVAQQHNQLALDLRNMGLIGN